MTEGDYFASLDALLEARIRQVASGEGGRYILQEREQEKFELEPRGLSFHRAIQLEKLPGSDWPCFKAKHEYAHKRCDSIVVCWPKEAKGPLFLLIELKSTQPGHARKQLGASLAFCHFVHRMVCVGKPLPPPSFGAITVFELPMPQKLPSHFPVIPPWDRQQPLQVDCPHMRFDRRHRCLPLAKVAASL